MQTQFHFLNWGTTNFTLEVIVALVAMLIAVWSNRLKVWDPSIRILAAGLGAIAGAFEMAHLATIVYNTYAVDKMWLGAMLIFGALLGSVLMGLAFWRLASPNAMQDVLQYKEGFDASVIALPAP